VKVGVAALGNAVAMRSWWSTRPTTWKWHPIRSRCSVSTPKPPHQSLGRHHARRRRHHSRRVVL